MAVHKYTVMFCPDPSSRMDLLPQLLGALSAGNLQLVAPFRNCFSCKEPPCPRLHLFPDNPYPISNDSGSWPSVGQLRRVILAPELLQGWLRLLLSLLHSSTFPSLNPTSFSTFSLCWSQGHFLINILHAKLHLRAWFPEHQLWHNDYGHPWALYGSLSIRIWDYKQQTMPLGCLGWM